MRSCDAWRSERYRVTSVANRCADERPIRFCNKSGELACEELNLEDKYLIGSTAYNALKARYSLTNLKIVSCTEEASSIEMEVDDTIAMELQQGEGSHQQVLREALGSGGG